MLALCVTPCWGSAKRKYPEFPLSHLEAGLKANVLSSFKSVLLEWIRQ